MKKGIIPDIHTWIERADQIIEEAACDSYIFVGDYWDNFNDTPTANREAAIWLAKRINEHPEDEFLLGNHDMQYVWQINQCSGYSPYKLAAIQSIGEQNLFRKHLRLHTWVGDILITHAGLTKNLVPQTIYTYNKPLENLQSWLREECRVARNCFQDEKLHWTVRAGQDRGGYAKWGGLNWGDWSNFVPIPGIRQICGHTKQRDHWPKFKDDNHCIDTALRHYAIIEDGKISIKTFGFNIIKEG